MGGDRLFVTAACGRKSCLAEELADSREIDQEGSCRGMEGTHALLSAAERLAEIEEEEPSTMEADDEGRRGGRCRAAEGGGGAGGVAVQEGEEGA
ncbi:hypothetical protein BHE74_00050074 [Ensete ventricosum]|nr:hypothetical protein GW17_00044218 [Ensete ventricosum]RWW44196.1 hypothetical protein BHE74_00050074 [Ensete ventricosum]